MAVARVGRLCIPGALLLHASVGAGLICMRRRPAASALGREAKLCRFGNLRVCVWLVKIGCGSQNSL
eukprot:14455687-Alexandrium_andersonii.AAC.1